MIRNILFGILALLLTTSALAAHGGDPAINVRVIDYNPDTYEYTISCDVPPSVDQRRYYAIDPVPEGMNEFYRTYNTTFTWHLDPDNYEEQVHTKAMYHIYCEVQNYSAPPGQQNMASEFHVDLRTERNGDVPDIYVLSSEGPRAEFKCDPPVGVDNFGIAWKLRSREATYSFPELNNRRLVNITVPQVGAGWDIVCTISNQDTGTSSSWDMPIEFFESGPVYIPTFEGCVPGEPCPWVDPSGTPPEGELILHTTPEADVFFHGKYLGQADGSGDMNVSNLVPGIYNLVLQKEGLEERSELIPIYAGDTLERTYLLSEEEPAGPMCYNTVFGIPATCEGGTITSDGGSGCRTIVCEQGAQRLQVQACNKPSGPPQYFEMYKQSSATGLKICIEETCIDQNTGFAVSEEFPICVNGTAPTAVCGNGVVESDEQCDDNNTNNDDGCSSTCQIEPAICGNGVVESGEQCDDNNTDNGDGCSNVCLMEHMHNGTYEAVAPIPDVALDIGGDSDGWTLLLTFENFTLYEPPNQTGSHVDGEGHAHWYLNGVKQGRIYNTSYDIGVLPTGEHDIEVRLATNNHLEYTHNNVSINDSLALLVTEENICYESVHDVQASCSGVITQDSSSGSCRTLVCDGLQVLACNKPDAGPYEYFEMYKQSSAAGVELCLGETCIAGNGFARSENYPICTEDSEPSDPVCGNGVVESGEQCDDNNTDNGDGCSSTCQTETVGPVCGNGVLESGEQCDDNNTDNGDGCSSTCQTETVGPVCGNGVVESGEQCDDNNTDNDDGCSSTCQTESGGPGACVESISGVPVICEGGEIVSDSTSGACRTVECWGENSLLRVKACDKPTQSNPTHFEIYNLEQSGNIDVCFGETCLNGWGYKRGEDYPICSDGTPTGPVCGNGVVESGEQCDDNNTDNGDGCSSTCQTETVGPVCGNGVVESGEQCDDNNTDNEDGCSSTCQTESLSCTQSVHDAQASCSGVITQDSSSGSCRTLVCDGLQVLACNKPNAGPYEYFEMYKQSSAAGVELCLDETCISSNGYAKSPNFSCEEGNTSSPIAWIEPVSGQTGTSPTYFHLNVELPENEAEIPSTDWEVWAGDELVWSAYSNTGLVRFHTHTPDGVFEGSRAGTGTLDYEIEHRVRMRYHYSNGSIGDWSTWRTFTTSSPMQGSSLEWSTAPGYRVDRFATDLDLPVHIALAPDGMYNHIDEHERPIMYVTELYGKVKVLDHHGDSYVYAENLLNFDPFGSITGGGQMGVIGLYVDDVTGDLFVGMVYVENDEVKNKVVRFFTSDDGYSYTGSEIIIDNIPGAPSHQVEQITKGPDGKLYIQFGDALREANAQDDSVLPGKIVRMNMDGSNVETYAKGFRNPFGGDWRPGTNQLFVTDNSPNTNDRLIRVEQGHNYQWGPPSGLDYVDEAIRLLNVSPVDVEFNAGNNAFPIETVGRLYVAVGGPIYTEGPTQGKEIWEFTLDEQGDVVLARHLARYTGTGYGTPIGLDFGHEGLYFSDIYGEPGFIGLGETEGNIYLISPGEPDPCLDCTGSFRAGISVANWYPQDEGDGISYIFNCRGIDGSNNYRYDWHYENGQKLINTTVLQVYRKYPYGDQEYPVSCTVHDQESGENASANLVVNPDDFIPGGET